MAFGGSRTSHRMTIAIEEAGFIIHPMIAWVYGSGFPKATRIDTQIDKIANRIGKNTLELKREIQKRYKTTEMTLSQFNNKCGFEASGYLRESSTWANILPSREKWDIIKKVLACDNTLDSLFVEAEREIIGQSNSGLHRGSGKTVSFGIGESRRKIDITNSTLQLSQTWQGHRYGAQAMKPAMEPIIVFQKPYEGKPVENIIETGAGALNIDGGRIGNAYSDVSERTPSSEFGQSSGWNKHNNIPSVRDGTKGRWPANFIQTHSPDCKRTGTQPDDYQINRFTDGAKPFGDGAGHEFDSEEVKGETEVWECVEGCPVLAINLQSGNLGKSQGGRSGHTGAYQGGFKQEYYGNKKPGYGDKGGAGRFFHQSGWEIENANPFLYQAKANKSERNAGLKGFPLGDPPRSGRSKPAQGRKTALGKPRENSHPTVKPIALNQHLATLLLPPPEYAPRRLFVPFSGVASEMIGAMLAGWEEIVGVELTEEYIPIAEARFSYWKKKHDEDRMQKKMF